MNIFTKDDYRKIQAWLKANSIKDSDLTSVNDTIPEEDTLVLVQKINGVLSNVKISIKNLINSTLSKVIINTIIANAVKVNNTLTVTASNVKIDNEKGTTLQDIIDWTETIEKAAKGWNIEYQVPSIDEPTVRAKYVLKDSKGVPKGDVIKVYKDSAITNVYLGTTKDTCNENTGEVTKEPVQNNNEALSIVYRLDTGKYSLVNVPIGIFTREAEFDKYKGLGVTENGQVFVKLASDVESSNYLHFNDMGEVSADGIENRILQDLGTIINSVANDSTMWGQYKKEEGTKDSPINEASRWGQYKQAEADRSELLNIVSSKVNQLEQEQIQGGVYDVSTHNDGAVFESLSALLSSSNLSTLIPASVRYGGMSIRFIQNSDNKYVQYRLMATSFSTIESDWQGVDDEPTAGSDNLIKSGAVKVLKDSLDSITGFIDLHFENKQINQSIYADGSIGADPGYKLNELIPVKAGEVINLKANVGRGSCVWCLYSTNEYNKDNVISSKTGNNKYTEYEFTVSEDSYLGTCYAGTDIELKHYMPLITINGKTFKYNGTTLFSIEDNNDLNEPWNTVASGNSVAVLEKLIASNIDILTLDKDTNNGHYIGIVDDHGEIKNESGQTFCVIPIQKDDIIIFTSKANDSQVVLSYSPTEVFKTTEILIITDNSREVKTYFKKISKDGYIIISGVATSLFAAKVVGSKVPTVDEYPDILSDPNHAASSKSLATVMSLLGLSYREPIFDVQEHLGYYINAKGEVSQESGYTYCIIPVSAGETVVAIANPGGLITVLSYNSIADVEGLTQIIRGKGQETKDWKATFTNSGYAIVSGKADTLDVLIYKNTCDVPFSGTENDLTDFVQNHSFGVKAGQKYVSVQQCFSKNINNYAGNTVLMSLHGANNTQVDIVLEHDVPSNVLLPQKENTEREQDIKYVDFPMSVKQDRLLIKQDDTEIAAILLDSHLNQPFVRRVPAMTIQYIPASGVDLSTMTDLKMYITKNANNIVDTLSIKKGNTLIYSYQFDSTRDIALVYRDIRDGLATLENYEFKVTFADIDEATVSDILCTKAAGLPFVTEYSSNCKTTGTTLYDNYAVFIEVLEDNPFELEAVVREDVTKIFYEGQYLGQFSGDFTFVSYGSSETDFYQVSYDPNYNLFNTKRPIIRGMSGHEFSTQPIPNSYSDMEKDPYGTGKGTAIGAVNYLVRNMKKRGWSNVSTDEVTQYMLDKNYPLPHKCFFIEEDDLGGRIKVNKIFSEEEPYVRQMEILKMTGVKMCYALMLGADYKLFQKIENGTATEEEKNTLTTMMPNSYVYKLRAMMANYGWSVSIHTFVGPITHVTAARYDDVVLSIRNSIKWMERMLGRTPRSYVTDLTGNSSPYFRRVMQMFGLQRVYHDDNANYSQGRNQTYVDRDGFYGKTTFNDFDW